MERPASWSFSIEKQNAKVGDVVELTFSAELKKGWYMYSIGPYESAPATTFTFEPNDSYEFVGKISPQKAKHKVDEYIGEYDYFTEKAVFKQKVKLKSTQLTLKGAVEFSTCSSESGICLPPREEAFDFSGQIAIADAPLKSEKEVQTASEKGVQKDPKPIASISKEENEKNKIDSTVFSKQETQIAKIENSKIEVSNTNSEENLNDMSLINFFIISFLSGLVALLTPCVFPMIPMTVTFFLNSEQSRAKAIFKALIYGLSIILIYTFVGFLVAKLAGPEAANFLSTHWLPNLFFFATFIIFALSFLGLFEITLPSFLVNASDRQSDKGGLLGVFFMASTLVLVSFSCTGPIVGSILVQSAGGAVLKPIVGMFAFSLAFALPFTLFAIFPTWLNNLPKSGGWLNTVKVVLGFVELILAFKFLSLADQAYHWGILDRDVNIAIWVAVLIALTLYLFGFLVLPHDTKTEKTSVPRAVLGIFSLAFAIYILPGMWGAPLKPLSGYLPPLADQDFKISQTQNAAPAQNTLCETPKYADFLTLPHELKGYFDYNQALACSKQLKKPIFVDFTGHGCVNCREMEANIWSQPEVLSRLQKDFIILALYVDDKTELPQSQWFTSSYDGKVKSSIGKQNADFQITKYNNNAQPYYLVLDSDGNTLSGPISYTKDYQSFINFLDKGKKSYNFSN